MTSRPLFMKPLFWFSTDFRVLDYLWIGYMKTGWPPFPLFLNFFMKFRFSGLLPQMEWIADYNPLWRTQLNLQRPSNPFTRNLIPSFWWYSASFDILEVIVDKHSRTLALWICGTDIVTNQRFKRTRPCTTVRDLEYILEQYSFQEYTTCWVFLALCHMTASRIT